MKRLMRQGTIIFMLVVSVLLLTACNSDDKEENAELKKSEIKIVKTIDGDIEIPVNPQRIVADNYIGSLIILDKKPIGTVSFTNNPYFQDKLTDVTEIGDGDASLETVVSLKPDLIITSRHEAEIYEKYSKIAPTIRIPYGEFTDAHEEITYFGDFFGKEEEAKQWLAEFDKTHAQLKKQVDTAIGTEATFTILEATEKSYYAYGDNFGRGGQSIYQALGRKPPVAVADEIMKTQYAELSEEVIPKYVGDYIILTTSNKSIDDYRNDPLWSKMDAVKNNRLYVWPSSRAYYFDPLAVLAQTKELAQWLTEEAGKK